jgi:hypothetical protein
VAITVTECTVAPPRRRAKNLPVDKNGKLLERCEADGAAPYSLVAGAELYRLFRGRELNFA